MRERVVRHDDFFTAAYPQAHRRGPIICFRCRYSRFEEASASQAGVPPLVAIQKGTCPRTPFLDSIRVADDSSRIGGFAADRNLPENRFVHSALSSGKQTTQPSGCPTLLSGQARVQVRVPESENRFDGGAYRAWITVLMTRLFRAKGTHRYPRCARCVR
jgi:hypothetical protein